jgi:hypothetical protein
MCVNAVSILIQPRLDVLALSVKFCVDPITSTIKAIYLLIMAVFPQLRRFLIESCIYLVTFPVQMSINPVTLVVQLLVYMVSNDAQVIRNFLGGAAFFTKSRVNSQCQN